MSSTVMDSLRPQLPRPCLHRNSKKTNLLLPSTSSSSLAPSYVICGLRGGQRKPLWRSRVLSYEAIQVVQSLKLAKSMPSKLEEVFHGKLTRLLKSDLLDTLAELQRQNELDLALKVFKCVRKEVWYRPDLSLYCDMIQLLGRKKLIEMVEELFEELKQEGLEPDTRAFTEVIGAYLQVDMIDKAMEMYGLMKKSGCYPDKLTFTILIRNLEKVGKEELASSIKKECADYMDNAKKFLTEVKTKEHVKRRTISLV